MPTVSKTLIISETFNAAVHDLVGLVLGILGKVGSTSYIAICA